jgi:hypothetical protein
MHGRVLVPDAAVDCQPIISEGQALELSLDLCESQCEE